MNTVYTSINLFGDEIEVLISYEVTAADPHFGIEREINIAKVELQRAEKWDGNGNPTDFISSVDLLPFLSEWAIREVEEAVVIRNLELEAQERSNARLSRIAS